jgi:hypothetical protein
MRCRDGRPTQSGPLHAWYPWALTLPRNTQYDQAV